MFKKNVSGKNGIELVAPAGDYHSFLAAVENGADAVYLGLKKYNARRRAENFTLSDLKKVVNYAHLRGVRVYLTLNTLIKDTEMESALKTAENALEAGVDALIVQDLGLIENLNAIFSGIRLHASTQINTHNLETAKYLKELGFKRIIPARELTLNEIREIKRESGLEVEIFGHGALCYSYSGQCLFSSMVGGRSGNRGLCPQACRLHYDFYIPGSENMKEEKLSSGYLLSTKDLWTLPLLNEIILSGVDALKIEGRLKSAEYVAVVTSVYAREIERAIEMKEEYRPLPENVRHLEEVFSRGFSTAYLNSIRGNKMMNYQIRSNIGSFIGRVSFVDNYKGTVAISLRKKISKGDILEIWVSRGGSITQKIEEIFIDGKEVETAPGGKKVEIKVEKDRHLIRNSDRVYRIFNENLSKKAERSYKSISERRIPVGIDVAIKRDGSVVVEVKSTRNPDYRIKYTKNIKIEKARKSPTTGEIIENQFRKVGNTAYQISSLKVSVPRGIYIPIRKLNLLRRQALEKLDTLILKDRKPSYKKVEKSLNIRGDKRMKVNPAVAVKAGSFDMAMESINSGANIVYLRYPTLRIYQNLDKRKIARLHEHATQKNAYFGLSIPSVLKKEESEKLKDMLEELREYLDVLLVDNLGMAINLCESGFQVVSDYHLNVFNSYATRLLSKTMLRRATMSVELSLKEIKSLASSSEIPLEALVFGDLEIMTAEHCPYLSVGEVKKEENSDSNQNLCPVYAKEESLTRKRWCVEGAGNLVDRKGYSFPVLSDNNCRGYVYNSRKLCAVDLIEELFNTGVSYFRLDLLLPRKIENVSKAVSSIVNIVRDVRKEKGISVNVEKICGDKFTRGHYLRGVK